jgi:ribonuclease G
MQRDRAKHNILPITKFGLMQITRQRVRPATEINTSEVCPSCNGTGKIASTIVVDETIERELAFYVKEKGYKQIVMKVNPMMEAYLNKGILSFSRRWAFKYKCKLRIIPSTSNSLLEVIWLDKTGDRIDV